jgi:threonine/homoserine/homoserine lactone efflux protein
MNGSLFIGFLLTVTVLMLTPGPDMLFCMASGLRAGPRAGFLASLGTATGEVIHISAAALGLAALFEAEPTPLDAVRIVGAIYLVVLGIRALRHRNEQADDHAVSGASAHDAYWRGLATNLLNPKMALFTIAFLPQFVDPNAGSVALQFLVLGASFIALEIAVDGSVGILAGRFTRGLRQGRARRSLNVTAGAVYVGLAAKLALER